MRETYDERREREHRDPMEHEPGPGHETYDEKLERWRRDWHREWDAESRR